MGDRPGHRYQRPRVLPVHHLADGGTVKVGINQFDSVFYILWMNHLS